MRRLIASLGMAAWTVCAASPVLAQGATASSATDFVRMADRLKPGQWVWAPGIASAVQVLVYVDLSRRLKTVYRNGVRIGVTSAVIGRRFSMSANS